MSRERIGRMDQSGVLPRLGAMARAFERVLQLGEATTVPPFGVLLVPATPVCPSVRPGDKPVHLSFGLFLALLFRTVRGHLKEGVDRRTDVSVYDRLIGTQLGFQEKLCAGFENSRKLWPQRRNEVRHNQRNYTQPQ
jgi:hypothetical protein